MSSSNTPGASVPENERYVLFQLQCCMQEMNSALKIIDTALNKLTNNIESMRRRRRAKMEPNYHADAMPGLTISFS